MSQSINDLLSRFARDCLLLFVYIHPTGTIITSVILDAEAADHFWLTVVAEDGGVIHLSASVQVYQLKSFSTKFKYILTSW